MNLSLYDKLWRDHVVHEHDDGSVLLYIDRHLLHEVTSPQAFSGLAGQGRRPFRVAANLAVDDHNVPTVSHEVNPDPLCRLSLAALADNCRQTGIRHFAMGDVRQGIVHVVGPEQGVCLPGMTIVCGDSHTSTNGALGALAFGIGTSDVEHVLATQCIVLGKARNMRITVSGHLQEGIGAKDLVLAIIGRIGVNGAQGCALEFAGAAVQDLSMEGRMTVCNMSIEAGGRYGLIAVDETTIDYVRGRPFAPQGELWEQAVVSWQDLHSDTGAVFDQELFMEASSIQPQVTWGTSPDMVVPISGVVPDPDDEPDAVKREGMIRALRYMDLVPDTSMSTIAPDRVFLGSCTNARIEDLRVAARVLRGRKRSASIRQALVVPGSGMVKRQAEQEGLAQVFVDAGFEWRQPGCSMCLAMNADRLEPGERCASTSNRNFEGRQGQGGRTHLLSPASVAAAAIAGHFVDAREFLSGAA